jgi:hypothetical protein
MNSVSLEDLSVSNGAHPDEVLKKLNSTGVAIVPNYLSAARLEAVQRECELIASEQTRGTTERNYHCGRSILVDRRKWDSLACPAIEETLSASFLEHIATGYFQQPIAFNYQFFVTRETTSGVPITGLHYDRLVTLKFFIYLLDTSKENGAIEMIPGTHKSVSAAREFYVKRGVRLIDLPNFDLQSLVGTPIPMEGAAGTMVIFTTDVVHQGGVVSEGKERWVLRAHTRPLPLPQYNPAPWRSRQWWRESAFNPQRYFYRLRDGISGETPPLIHA